VLAPERPDIDVIEKWNNLHSLGGSLVPSLIAWIRHLEAELVKERNVNGRD